jgi:hypothetical protein
MALTVSLSSLEEYLSAFNTFSRSLKPHIRVQMIHKHASLLAGTDLSDHVGLHKRTDSGDH